jgi:hypothetical protein
MNHPGVPFNEKTKGRKSRETVPVKNGIDEHF